MSVTKEQVDQRSITNKHVQDIVTLLFLQNWSDEKSIVDLFELEERDVRLLTEVLIERKTFTECEEIFQLTKERIRQLFDRALRRLRNRILRGATRYKQYLAIEEENKKLISENEYLRELSTKLSRQQEKNLQLASGDVLSFPIEDLNLSTRAYGVLKNCRINTVGELIAYDSSEIVKFRNCGVKTLENIRRSIEPFGVKLI